MFSVTKTNGMRSQNPERSLRRQATVVLGLVLALAGLGLIVGCKQKAAAPPAPEVQTQPLPGPGLVVPSGPPPGSGTTVVPDAVKVKWKAVKLLIEDKKASTSREFVVTLGDALPIPESTLVVKVKAFLPDLKIDGNTFMTASEELQNPAVQVSVEDSGKEIFNGWLFQLFPTVHPFQHERFNVLLRDAVSSS